MAYTITATFSSEAKKLEGSFPVDMYVLNASVSGTDYKYYANMNQNIYGYQLDATGDLTTTDQLYTALPIKRDIMKSSIDGEITGISISIPNTDRAAEALIQQYNYFRNCDVHVITFFAKHLPTGSGSSYIGVTEDVNAGIKEKFYVDSVSSNEEIVTFDCKSKFSIDKAVIPGRKYTRECGWDFSSTGNCSAPSAQVASWTTCDKTLYNCRERKNEGRFGGFPSVPRTLRII